MILNTWTLHLVFVSLLAGAFQLYGQTERYELGRRVQRYENAWQTADSTARARSTKSMQIAVTRFFSFRFKPAAKAIDQAYLQVYANQPHSPVMAWCVSQQVLVKQRVADIKNRQLKLVVDVFYDSTATFPSAAELRVTFRDTKGTTCFIKTKMVDALVKKGNQLFLDCQWKAEDLGPGDFRVAVDLLHEKETFQLDEFIMSRVVDLDKRLARMNSQIDAVKETGTPTGYQTLKTWRDRIRESCQNERLEIDYPVDQLFNQFDALCDCDGDSIAFLNSNSRRELWLTLRKQRKTVPLRVHLPNDLSQPRPILFLFHGAGGSENMFFETYGAGRCVELAKQRNWIVVSPNQGLLSNLQLDCRQMIDVLSLHVAVDHDRVMLLGHSMGAGQVIKQVNANADLFAAAVAVGGGRAQRNADRLAKPRWFVAAGEFDFGKQGALALHQSLHASGISSRYQEYPDVEHLVVVQASLDDIFQFLDGAIDNKNQNETDK